MAAFLTQSSEAGPSWPFSGLIFHGPQKLRLIQAKIADAHALHGRIQAVSTGNDPFFRVDVGIDG